MWMRKGDYEFIYDYNNRKTGFEIYVIILQS